MTLCMSYMGVACVDLVLRKTPYFYSYCAYLGFGEIELGFHLK